MDRDESRSPVVIDNLAELRTYVEIVDAGSLAGAARALGLTPNAVSRRLSSLEARVGKRLILRTTRRLRVTDEGRRFHARCQTALECLAQAERELVGGDALGGTLRIALHTDMVCPALMEALGLLLERAPGLRLETHVVNRFVDPLQAGLDVSVCAGRPAPSSLICVSVGRLTWGLAAAPSYVAARGRPRTPERLVEHSCLRLKRDRSETSWKLRREGSSPRRFPVGGRFETTDGTVLAAALYAGLGIGVRLRSEIEAGVEAGTLVSILPQWRWTSTPIYALMPAGRSRSPALTAVLDALREATRSLS